MKKLKKKTITNKKVRNATPNEYDGIKFKSKLETYVYKQLKAHNLKAEYEPTKYELLPAFIFKEKKIRPITYTPDFVNDKFIIECKGYPNEKFPLKLKLFYYYLLNNNINNINYYIVKNKKDVDNLVKQLKDENIRS